jgi:RNA-directed DNA polymerase
MSEKPVHSRLRRLVDWINLTGAKKVHSLIDKVYKRKNLEMAWERVKTNQGSGGVDGETLQTFEAQLDPGWRWPPGACSARRIDRDSPPVSQ